MSLNGNIIESFEIISEGPSFYIQEHILALSLQDWKAIESVDN
jgi:hypothetical protein